MIHVKPTPSISIALLSLALVAAAGAAAQSQSGTAPAAGQNQAMHRSTESETDIGGSFYEAMNSTTTAGGVTQTPTNSDGGMFELRHIHSSLIGYELTFSYNPANETIGPAPAGSCGIYCSQKAQSLTSKASQVGLDWVVSKKYGNLRPFAAGGLGFFMDFPGATIYPNNDVVRPAFLYGVGVDFSITAHLGVRAQYRGVMYKTPNLTKLFPAQGVYTMTNEPMGGIFYRF